MFMWEKYDRLYLFLSKDLQPQSGPAGGPGASDVLTVIYSVVFLEEFSLTTFLLVLMRSKLNALVPHGPLDLRGRSVISY